MRDFLDFLATLYLNTCAAPKQAVQGLHRLIPMWRKFRDVRILGVIGFLFFAVVIAILNATVYTPEAAVMRYLSALEDGRRADVESIVWGSYGSLIYDIRLPTDAADRPRDPEIVDTYQTAGLVVVTVRVVLDGRAVESQLAVERDASWLPLANWRFVDPPIATIRVESTLDSGATVNGSRANEEGFAYVPSIATVGAPSRWFDAEPQKIVLDSLSRDYSVALDLTPSPRLIDDMSAAVRDYLDACAAQKTLVPKKCPFAGFTSEAIAAGPVWSISTYPTPSIAVKDGQWFVSGKGTAELSVSLVDFATEKTVKYSEVIPYTIEGTIAGLDGANPKLVVTNTVRR